MLHIGRILEVTNYTRLLEKGIFPDNHSEEPLEIFSQMKTFIPSNPNNLLLGVHPRSLTNVQPRIVAKSVDCSIVCQNGKNTNNLNVH